MELQEKMFALMDRYSQSGLTQKEFCAQQGLTLAKFGYWRRRWKAAQDTPVSPGGFLPLSFEGTSSACVLIYPNGIRLEFSSVSVGLLRELVQGHV